MTRRKMREAIRQRLEDYQLPVDEDSRQIVDTAVDCALEYVLDFAMQVNEKLVEDLPRSYSQVLVAGTFIQKLKKLLGEE